MILYDTELELEPPAGYILAIVPNSALNRYGIKVVPLEPIEKRTHCTIAVEILADNIPKIGSTLAYFYLIRTAIPELVVTESEYSPPTEEIDQTLNRIRSSQESRFDGFVSIFQQNRYNSCGPDNLEKTDP